MQNTMQARSARQRELHIARAVDRIVKPRQRDTMRSTGPAILRYHRRQNEFVQGSYEARDWWLYDTVTFGQGVAFAKTLLFQTPQSGSKFLNQTNLYGNGGLLPAGEMMDVRSIRCYITNSTVPADVQNIINNVSVQWFVGSKPIIQCTPEALPAGMGGILTAVAQVGTAPSGSAPTFTMSNGQPDMRSGYNFTIPYRLGSLEPFNVTLNPEVAFNLSGAGTNPVGAGVTIKVYFEGIYYRLAR